MYYFRSSIAILGITALFSLSYCSSGDKSSRPSPPASDSTVINGIELSINYSTPGVKNRKIWGGLVPYGEIWRTGANEATVFTSSDDILINDKLLPAGKYSYFTMTSDSTWTIILNKEWDQWGAYNYDESQDALRLKVTPVNSEHTERMKFEFNEQGLKFEWENLSYQLRIKPAKADA